MTANLAPELTTGPRKSAVQLRPWEIAGFALFLAAVMAVQVALSMPKLLLGRGFWQDEQFTHFIASDPSLRHLLHAVREGADTNPPVFHLLVREFAAVVPGRPEVVYRLFTLLCTWLAFIAVYIILRRSFDILPSVIAVLALWGSPLIVHESFDARFYAPMLAAAAWFCLVFSCQCRRWLQYLLIAVLAALLCTIHYFGIIALGAVIAGVLVLRPGDWRDTARRMVPALAGPAALAGMIPILLGQKAGLSVATWVPAFRPDNLLDTFNDLFVTIPLGILAVSWWLFQWIEKKPSVNAPPIARRLGPMAGLTGLLLVPVVVTVFSVLVQPSMIPKYMIVTTLATAPILALLASVGPRWGQIALVVVLGGVGLLQLRHEAWMVDDPFEVQQQRLIASCEQAIQQGLPVVSISRREAYTLYYAAPPTHGHVYVADIRPMIRCEVGKDLMRHLILETDFAAKYEKIYPVPPLLSIDAIKRLGPFHLVGWDPWVAAFKQHVPLKHLRDDVYIVQ
jgi:hypothetical protein